MTTYWTSLTETYVSDWTPANAIREIVQNCLDSPSTFEYDMSGEAITFTSKNVKLEPKTLLMGVSNKRNDPTTVGGKGEGYKNSLLILQDWKLTFSQLRLRTYSSKLLDKATGWSDKTKDYESGLFSLQIRRIRCEY